MGNFSNFHDMLQDFQKTLRHDDYVQMTDLCTNLIWIETMVTSLDHMDNTMYRSDIYLPLLDENIYTEFNFAILPRVVKFMESNFSEF